MTMGRINQSFSDEIVEFSKLIDETFKHVSMDIKTITTNSDKKNKEAKTDIDKIKKEINELRNIMNIIKSSIGDIEKKVKKRVNIVSEVRKPTSNKDDIKILTNEIADIKLSIKEIERKLKMD